MATIVSATEVLAAEGGGLYLNNVRLTEVGRRVGPADVLFGKHLLLRKGRRNYAVVTVG